MILLHTITFLVIFISFRIVLTSNRVLLNDSAFCFPRNLVNQRNFPTDVPEQHLPWIWDAVYDGNKGYVELTTLSHLPCKFDRSTWMRLLREFPSYSHQLAYGKESNILVPSDEISIAEESFLLGKYVTCEYFKDKKIQFRNSSYLIRGRKIHGPLGSLQVRCPLDVHQYSKIDSIRLVLGEREQYTQQIYGNATSIVPINCNTPIYDENQKKYGISICTATGRFDQKKTIEWIEYHRLIGIDHFYIYDTSPSNYEEIIHSLSDYIKESIVTIVSWPYLNCVRHMGTGRWTMVFDNYTYMRYDFKAPYAIAQSAALASCYSRFKHSSKYMMHIDDDEFIVLNSTAFNNNEHSNLFSIAEDVFYTFPNSSALEFLPVNYYPCHNTRDGYQLGRNNVFENRNETINTNLPRLGTWDVSEIRDYSESKLLMRTEAVGMFFAHYITLLEPGPWKLKNIDIVTYDLSMAAMIHYKYPHQLSDQILEGIIPLDKWNFTWFCSFIANHTTNHGLFDYHAKISRSIEDQLKLNYVKRIRSL